MLDIKPTGAALGAEIRGIDLSQPMAEATLRAIEHALHEHEVIFFRGQRIGPEQHVAFSGRFGELEKHIRVECCKPGFPEIFVVSNVIENGKPIGTQDAGLFWHSDLAYMARPSRGSLFYAHEVPHDDAGKPLGDTMFASTTAAWRALPEDLKRIVAGRRAVTSYAKGYYRDRNSGPRPPLTEAQKARTPDVEHPIMRTHPYTKKPCLFVNEGYTTRIVDLPPEESGRVLDLLFEHVSRPEFVYRHQWQEGDFLIWDNCSTQHRAVFDYALPQRRRMERTTLTGTAPF
ncbi:MAG: TauD/TfdA family dioxygenase [Betaproteobacteria bacterium]|nr:MAG: TauD/TfdA family dioxygenase [Betaproteobacteria bacterium]